jgi:hypothetical protein
MSQSRGRKENAEESTPGVVSGIGKDAMKSSSATKRFSMMRTGLDMEKTIQLHIQDGTFSDDLFPSNKLECVMQLRKAKKEVKTIIRESFQRQEDE